MMAPTILDICHLLGLSLIGTPFGHNHPDLNVPFSIPPLNSSFSDFAQSENPKKGPMTDKEFFSFLFYWLCKFLFCISSQRIMPEFVPLAKALALGKKIALAPYILGHVYRACSQFCKKPLDTNQGGPLWILQLWLFAYFTALHSRCLKFLLSNPTSYKIKCTRVSLYPSTFAFYFSFFHQLPAFPFSHTFFYPFEANISPAWLRTFLADRNYSQPQHRDMWASILTPKELFIGTLNPKAYKCIAEAYCPAQFAK